MSNRTVFKVNILFLFFNQHLYDDEKIIFIKKNLLLKLIFCSFFLISIYTMMKKIIFIKKNLLLAYQFTCVVIGSSASCSSIITVPAQLVLYFVRKTNFIQASLFHLGLLVLIFVS